MRLSRCIGIAAAFAAATLLVASVFALVASAHPQTSQDTLACGQRVTVIGARGSGDPQNGDALQDKYGDVIRGMGKPGAAFAKELANRLPHGAVTFIPVTYPAVGLLEKNWRKIVNLAGAATQLGFLGGYTGSVNDGKDVLKQIISTEQRVCPSVKLVLVGYSQGAQVVADVFQREPQLRKDVVAVVLFGDPYFNGDDNRADVGSYDPSRFGALGRRGFYPTSSTTRVFSICHHDDPICQGGKGGRLDFSQHTNYQSDLWISVAATKIAAEFASGQGGETATTIIPNVSVGRIKIGEPAAALRSQFPSGACTTSSSGDAFCQDVETIARIAGGATGVNFIEETSPRFTTTKGIGVGSTVASLLKAYPNLQRDEEGSERYVLGAICPSPSHPATEFFTRGERMSPSATVSEIVIDKTSGACG